jgi:SAM-dependent methyltransferase
MNSVNKTCQLCGRNPLEEFVVPTVATYAVCRTCCLYQHGPLVGEEVYGQDVYYTNYERERRRKLRTASIRINRIASSVETQQPRLLDIGCGTGTVIEAANRRGWQAEGVDLSPYAVGNANERGINATVVDGTELPYEDQSFDVVTAWNLIEHVDDVRVALAEWWRVLRVGGVLAVDTSDAACLKVKLLKEKYRRFWRWDHRYAFTPWNLEQFFLRAGFKPFRPPFVGNPLGLSPQMAAYAYAYRTQYACRRLLRINKPFELFARKVDASSGQNRAAA